MTIPDYDRKIAKNTQGSKKRRHRFKTRLPNYDHPLTYTILEKAEESEANEPGIKITQADSACVDPSREEVLEGAVGGSGNKLRQQNSLTVPEQSHISPADSLNSSRRTSQSSINDAHRRLSGGQGTTYFEAPIKKDYRKSGDSVDAITESLNKKL